MGELDAGSGGTASRTAQALARLRGDIVLVVVDGFLAASAFAAALTLRFNGDVPEHYQQRLLHVLPVVVAVVLTVGWCWGLYGQLWRHASVLEARRLLLAGVTSMALLLAWSAGDPQRLPLSVVILGAAGATLLHGLIRFQARLFAFRRRGGDGQGVRVLVVGAGQAGAALIRDMLTHPHAHLVPVGLLDDDPGKHGRSCHGIRVLGPVAALAEAARATAAQHVVLAISDAPPALVNAVADLADRAGLLLRVVPPVQELPGLGVTVRDVRDVHIDDLLGRAPVTAQDDAVHELLHGRRVLITGAGGSIGSEIARQVAACGPAALLLLDNDETHLYEIAARLPSGPEQVLLDIRDRDALFRLFARHRPEVVFHAAAHKHVPLLEGYPSEAIKTNIAGTQNLVDAAAAHAVESFMFVSTDKAVRPRAVMGATKAVGEHIVLSADDRDGRYSAVRFGNVLGSRGSVVPTFMDQIQRGGPVTITDPRMTRFFMTIPEAVQLVLISTAMADGGEIFMLDMGEPVRILDLAQRMVRLSGRRLGEDVEIRITGTRPGEKLEEELHTAEERVLPTSHPSIVRLEPVRLPAQVLQSEVARLVAAAWAGHDAAAREGLFALVTRRAWLVSDHGAPYPPLQRSNVLDLVGKEASWTSSTT